MFPKVLIAEELDCISMGMVHVFEELSISEFHYANYCDDAFLKIKKALQHKKPYNLLISDLSFKSGHWDNKLNTGGELIAAVKKIQPEIKTIVFSTEDKFYKIKSLFNDLGINSYVSKGSNSTPQLKKAIESIYAKDEKFVLGESFSILNNKSLIEIEPYDIAILKALSEGLRLNEIAFKFKNTGIIPCGNSSIEKRINKLRIYFSARNNVHLMAIAKDIGLV